MAGAVVGGRIDWIPSLGLAANFFLNHWDFFAGLIFGIGLFVMIYAQSYFGRSEDWERF